jgi:translation initiation factor IF-2
MKRPPIVVVMGHVDHGKTSLLDYIRKTNIAGREAGSITQSIGAYEISHKNQKITFIDTPGHQIFARMRSRGVKIADVAVLVVAIDDGVQEQTQEVFGILQAAKTPFVVAITKIDKKNAEISKVKDDLSRAGILLEGYGGNISWQAVSSKTGEGIDQLLDLILLAAEMEDLSYQPDNPGRGYILESKLDNRKGVTVTAIVIDGKIKTGDQLSAGNISAKIRLLENFLGKPITEAIPSNPVLIIGFKEMPLVGSELIVGKVEPVSLSVVPDTKPASYVVAQEGQVVLDLILKADSVGSLEALSEVLQNLPLPENHRINIINQGIGEITDGDVKWRKTVIGFQVTPSKAADNLAKIHQVKIFCSPVIYELIKSLEEWIKDMDRRVISGELEVLAIFGKKGGRKQVIGGKVIAGEIVNNAACGVQRQGKDWGVGRIINLQKGKEDANKVDLGNECGLLFSAEVEIKVGDHLICK